ncbi:MAG: hypothetical protein GEV08_18835 [Acidimicrobiia bacterium]|nr:hypothetical protein [Acidimicrobiia bacterium]
MASDFTIGIGTVGAGLWFSYDGGAGWRHIQKRINPEGNVRALRVDPHDPHRILAASDHAGVFVSEDNGYRWERLTDVMSDQEVWSLDVDPVDPDRIYVGSRPGGFRSVDGGATFAPMAMGIGAECPIGVPRTTNVVVDPRDTSTVWAGVEVDGIYRSEDGGDHWSHLGDIGPTPFHGDIHGFVVRQGRAGAQLHTTTPFGIATSSDEGKSWDWHEFGGFERGSGMPHAYCRGVFVKPDDPDTVLVGVGDYIPGRIGAIERSVDGGASWERVELPIEPNSTVYWMAMHRDVPDVVAAATIFGQVLLSQDAGATWEKLPDEFGEVRAVSLSPN